MRVLLFLLLLALGAHAEIAPPTRADAVLTLLNAERARHGLAALKVDPALRSAAQAHADYLARHAQASHLEQPSQPGFSGVQPWERARQHGYGSGSVLAEVYVVGLPEPADALLQLLSGPYHRHVLLAEKAQDVGIGLTNQPGLVINLGGAPRTLGGPDWILWPSPDQTGVPARACCERPRPAGLDEFGMPVSLQCRAGETLNLRRFELRAPDGSLVDAVLLQAGNDAALRQAAHVAYRVPRQALRAATRYTVQAEAECAGARLQREWSFETAP